MDGADGHITCHMQRHSRSIYGRLADVELTGPEDEAVPDVVKIERQERKNAAIHDTTNIDQSISRLDVRRRLSTARRRTGVHSNRPPRTNQLTD